MSDLTPAHKTRPRHPLASGCACPVRAAIQSLALLCLLISGVVSAQPTSAPAIGGGQDPAAAVATAKALMERKETAQAEEILQDLVDRDPRNVPAALALAELYEATGRREEAIELCGDVLSKAEPGNAEALRALRRLYYRGAFPRRLRLEYLKYGPVNFTVDVCRLSSDDRSALGQSRVFAYTTSLIFPAEMEGEKPGPWIRLPAASGVAGNLMYNRVAYGLIADPQTELLRTQWQMGYPSATVLLSATDYAPLCSRLLHLLLRGHVYIQEYLGIDQDPWNADVLRAFLTEEGPTGAEQFEDKVFYYAVGQSRPPLEWLRETFHELGHLLLPKIGPLEQGERWASGDLGERLLMGWLAEEAGVASGASWPSEAAAASLDKLCGSGHVDVAEYLKQSCRFPMSVWLAAPPDELSGDNALDRTLGFCLWIQAAHGRRMLGRVLRSAEGSTPEALTTAYKAAVSEALQGGPLSVYAGGLSLMRANLAEPPVDGATRLQGIKLGPQGSAVWRVYLPAGDWTLSVRTEGDTVLPATLRCDEQSPLQPGPDGRFALRGVAAGWRELELRAQGEATVEILSLSIGRPEAG